MLAVLGGVAEPARRALDARARSRRCCRRERRRSLEFALHWPSCCSRRRSRSRPGCCSASSRRCTARGRISSRRIKAQAGQPSGARAAARFRTSLVTAQIALSMALLISAGLFVKSLVERQPRRSRAQDRQRRDVRHLAGAERLRSGARSRALFDRDGGGARRRFRASSAVAAVDRAAARRQQLGQRRRRSRDSRTGRTPTPNARYNEVGAGLLPHARHAADRGPRVHRRPTRVGAPKVAIVNEAFAKKFNLGRDAVGKHMSDGGRTQRRSSTSRSSASCRTRSTAT